jgi:hypothetical protein
VRIRASLSAELADISDLEHDSAHDIASQHGYKATLKLVDSLR